MIETLSAIDFIAATVSRTAAPVSSASFAPFTAIDSVCLLFCAFWAMEAFICSRLLVVSWTAAACWLLPAETDWAVEESWPAADESAPAAERTWLMTSTSRATILEKAIPKASASERGLTSTLRSPPAIRSAVATIDLR